MYRKIIPLHLLFIFFFIKITHAADNFTVTPDNLSEIPLNTLQTFTVHWDKDGTPQADQLINISKTFGELIIDTIPLETDSNGEATFSIRSAEEGQTMLTVSTVTAGPDPLTLNFNFVQTLISYTLTTLITDNGIIEVNPPTDTMDCEQETCTSQYIADTEVTLIAKPEPNATFEEWTGDCTGLSNPATLTMTVAKTCTAHFILKTYDLNINLIGEGSGTVASDPAGMQCQTGTCSATYDSGTEITLTATANPGSIFTGWTGDGCSVVNETEAIITLDKATTCTASFQPLIAVQVTVTGEGVVTSVPAGIDCGTTCQAQYAKNAMVTLAATPTGAEAVFIGWQGQTCLNNTDTTIALQIDAAKSCTAQFVTATPVSGGIITTVVGNGTQGYKDNVPALEATLRTPSNVVVDQQGNLYIADTFNSVIRKVSNLNDPDTSTHLITTIAGDGTIGYSGENVNGTTAQLHWPYGITRDTANNLYIADTLNNLIRKLTPTHTITTFAGDVTKAGSKTGGYSGDGGVATGAEFDQPRSVAMDGQGNLYIADFLNHVIRKVEATTKIITTIAGTGVGGYSGDGGPAIEAKLNLPSGIAIDTEGSLYIADSGNQVVRKVSFSSGATTISSIESTNGLGIVDVAVDVEGILYLAERNQHVVHQLDTDGSILSTIAGIAGVAGYNVQEEEGPSEQAHLNLPVAVTTDNGGNLYIADSGNNRIRLVTLRTSLLLEKTGGGQGQVILDDTIICDDPTLTSGCVSYFPTNSQVFLEAEAADGYAFTHWTGDCAGTENPKTTLLDANKHCVVNFEPLYELTIEKPGDGQGIVNATPNGIQCGETCQYRYPKETEVVLTAQADADSLFKGWTGDCQATDDSATVKMTAKKTCQARFELLPKLTVTTVGNGLVIGEDISCGSNCEAIYPLDTVVTLVAQPEVDERFTGWSGDCSGVAPSVTITMKTAKQCTAHFDVFPRLTIAQTGKGQGKVVNNPLTIDCGDDCEETFIKDTSVTINAIPDGSSRFIGWEGDCLGMGNPATLLVNGPKVCTANFGLLPGLNIEKSGEGTITSDIVGIQCGNDCNEPYPDGTVVTMMATPQIGAHFVEWTGDCSGSTNPLPITVLGALQCVAHFEQLNANDTFTVTPSTVPGVLINTPKTFHVHWDRAGNPQGNQTINIATTLGTVEPTTLILDGNGNGQFTVYSPVEGASTLTVATVMPETEGGHSFTLDFEFFYSEDVIRIMPDDRPYALINTEQLLTIHWEKAGVPQVGATINLNTTLGTVTDSVVTDAEGNAQIITFSTIVGPAVITASAGLPSAQVSFQYVDNFSSIQFAAPTYFVNEADGKVILLVSRAASDEGIVTAGFEVVEGSAIVDVDYQRPAEPFNVSWADLDRVHKTITIPILQDPATEADKTFTVRLTGLSGNALLGQNDEATVIIVDTPDAGSLQFSTNEYRASEKTGEALITVDRIGGYAGDVSVVYATQAGTAKRGQDYLHTEGTLRWGHSDSTSQSFSIPILADDNTEAEETLTLALRNPTGNAKVGAIDTATLRLVDDLATPITPLPDTAGVLQIEEPIYEVSEGIGSLTLTVTRTQGRKGTVAVNYQTIPQTAQASRDFLTMSGELRWQAGDDTPQTITLGLVNNATVETAETLLLTLSNPSGGATLGDNAQTVITIEDDDATRIQFETERYEIKPGQTSVTATVTRTGSDIGQVSVAYTTVEETAKGGEDYQETSGTLVWASADRQPKTITIPLLMNEQARTERTFLLKLSTLTGNVNFGEVIQTQIQIPRPSESDCQPATTIDCYLTNDGTLRDITITRTGAVIGDSTKAGTMGSLGGTIKNDGVIQDAILLPGTVISAGPFETGIIKGRIRGDSDKPVTITHQRILAETRLTHVILGQGVKIDPTVVIEGGVCFTHNSLIPSGINLEAILGYFKTTTLQQQAVQLTSDVLCLPTVDGIVGAINGLPTFFNDHFEIKQNLVNGYLELDVEILHYTVLPTQAHQSWLRQKEGSNQQDEPLGLVIKGGEVIFITHTGREIKSITVPQAPAALRNALNQLGLNTLRLQPNGNLYVSNGDSPYYSARASLFSEEVAMPLGMNSTDIVPRVSNRPSWLAAGKADWIMGIPAVYLVFTHQDGSIRQQFFYPAPADPESSSLLGEEAEPSEIEGRMIVQRIAGEPCIGILDYAVTDSRDIREEPHCVDIEDVNGDGFSDYAIFFPNGDRQVMYRLP